MNMLNKIAREDERPIGSEKIGTGSEKNGLGSEESSEEIGASSEESSEKPQDLIQAILGAIKVDAKVTAAEFGLLCNWGVLLVLLKSVLEHYVKMVLSEGLVPIKEALGKSLMKYRWLTDDNVKIVCNNAMDIHNTNGILLTL